MKTGVEVIRWKSRDEYASGCVFLDGEAVRDARRRRDDAKSFDHPKASMSKLSTFFPSHLITTRRIHNTIQKWSRERARMRS